MAIISVKNVGKVYRTDEIETTALENVNLEVEKGEFISIMGPSGCGKSTLLNIIGLLDNPTTGSIEINGTTTDKMSDSNYEYVEVVSGLKPGDRVVISDMSNYENTNRLKINHNKK